MTCLRAEGKFTCILPQRRSAIKRQQYVASCAEEDPSSPRQHTVALRGAAAAMQLQSCISPAVSTPCLRCGPREKLQNDPAKMSMRASKRDPLSSAWKPNISEGKVGLKHAVDVRAVVCGAEEGECLVDLMDVSRGEGLRDKLAFTGDFEERLDKPHGPSPWYIRPIPRIHPFCLLRAGPGTSSHRQDPSVLLISRLIPSNRTKQLYFLSDFFLHYSIQSKSNKIRKSLLKY